MAVNAVSANSPPFPGFIFLAVGVIALGLYQHEAKRCGCLSLLVFRAV